MFSYQIFVDTDLFPKIGKTVHFLQASAV